MEAISNLWSAVTRGFRGALDLGAMAVGVAPTSVGLVDAACLPMEAVEPAGSRDAAESDDARLSFTMRQALGFGDSGYF
ncbi:hypothetical protein [Rubrivivax sp. A210]|uniref:hypothetical protein n=1 Tax=Rubrivivax sp. A210 TaxID=2772301 RepID=UPI00191B388E|nr:hypothetical protein [Rubrivivax sp. A210]